MRRRLAGTVLVLLCALGSLGGLSYLATEMVNADVDFRMAPSGRGPVGVFGTIGAGTTSSVEATSAWRRTTLTVDSGNVVLADGGHGGGVLAYTFPPGSTFVVGIVFEGTVTNTANFNPSTNDTFSFALGSAVAADDGTLSLTESSLCGSTGGNPATIDTDSGTTLTRAVSIARARCDSFCATYVGAAGVAGTVYINFAIPATSDSGANTVRATGTVELIWVTMSDG